MSDLQKNEKIKIVCYTLLFAFMMFVDQRTFTAMDHGRAAFTQAAILPFLFIMIMQMKRENLRHIVYRLYLPIGMLLFIGLSLLIYNHYINEAYWKYIIFAFEIYLYIFILLYGLLNRKTYFSSNIKQNWIFILWFVILFFMGLSRYDGYWNWFAFFVFVPLAGLNLSKREQKNIFLGLLFGIMISYILIQGYSFVFRPYDTTRYKGSFNNPNRNSLFYTVCFSAYLVNAYRLVELKNKKWLQMINLILASSILGFSVWTGCKSGALTELVIFCIYFFLRIIKDKKRIKIILFEVMVWIFMGIVMIPTSYLAARYLPPVFHHSVWFYSEYSEYRVHSFDPYDSSKYPNTIKTTNYIIGRYIGGVELFPEPESENLEEIKSYELEINHSQKYTENSFQENEQDEIDLEDAISEENRIEKGMNTYSARLFIWLEYIKRFNLFGHGKMSVYAHNVFIEILYYYGILFGGLFTLGYVVTGFRQLIFTMKEKTWMAFGILSFLALFGVYGMAEINWIPGQASLSLFLFMTCCMVWGKNSETLELDREESME